MGIRRVFEWNFDVPHFGFHESLLRRFAELDHVRLVPREREFVAFEYDFAAGADDFETVGAWGFAGRGDESASRAVRIFQISRDIVLDFDVVEAAKLAKAADTRRHSKQPLHRIQIVQRSEE